MPVEKTTPQLVKKGKGKKRPGYRGDAAYGRSSRSTQATSIGQARGATGPGGGASLGGGRDRNEQPAQQFIGGKSYNVTPDNRAERRRAELKQQLTRQPVGGNRIDKFGNTKKSLFRGGGGLGGLLTSIAGMMMGIPGLGLLTGGFGKLKEGLGSLNETLGDFREKTTGFRTQEEYEQARYDRQQQKRLDKLFAAKDRGYNTLTPFGKFKTTDFTSGQQAKIDDLLAQGYTPSTARNVLTGRDLKGFTESRGLQTPKTFSDPFANTVGTTTKVNNPANDAVSSVTRDYSGIEDYGVDINPQGSKSIFESLFPEGNLQDIIKNSKTQKDYNINATKDLVENLPGGVVKEYFAPAIAGVMSPFYDGIQAATRMTEADINRAMQTGALTPREIASEAYGLAFDRENPLSSAIERFTGAAAPLAERIANLNFSNPFISSAAAAEVRPAIGMENTGLGFSIPTGDVGLNASGRLGNLSATVDAIDALKGESVNPQINYSGDFGNTNVYGNYSDDVQNIGLNFNNDKGLSGGISYDAITGEPRFDIGFKRTFADGGLASMFTRRG